MQQTDSIQIQNAAGGEGTVVKHWPPTPAEIISWLPRDATPAQQDSAIQRYIKPKEIRWSQRPDTLHLPGHTAGKSVLDWRIPQYYKQTFFSDKPYFHPEIMGGRQGVAGDPRPYTIAGDNFMTSVLILCFVLTLWALRGNSHFIGQQLKALFYPSRTNSAEVGQTTSELRFILILMAELCLMSSILLFNWMKVCVADTFIIDQTQIIFIFSAIFAAIIGAKYVLYQTVNNVFFGSKNNRQFIRTTIFLFSLMGLFLVPLVFIQSFFNLSESSSEIYILILALFYHFLLFSVQRQIFFAANGRFLQNILYFCILELLPISISWYFILQTIEYFKINF